MSGVVVTVRTAVQTGEEPPRGASTERVSTPRGAASAAARHTGAAEKLAAEGNWEEAYQHLRAAVRLLHGGPTSTDEVDQLRREHAEAREQSRRDSLTASYNRRYLDERLTALLADPACRGAGIAVAFVDADHFKQVNDTYGHLFGDRVLQRIVGELDTDLPEGAFCARYGGEEFALVMPGLDVRDAVRVCEAARHRIDRHPWRELDANLRVTVSIGVAHSSGPAADLERLVSTADSLLYTAKHSGRNAVAFQDERMGLVRLAGAAGGRRAIRQPPRGPAPACDRTGSAP